MSLNNKLLIKKKKLKIFTIYPTISNVLIYRLLKLINKFFFLINRDYFLTTSVNSPNIKIKYYFILSYYYFKGLNMCVCVCVINKAHCSILLNKFQNI